MEDWFIKIDKQMIKKIKELDVLLSSNSGLCVHGKGAFNLEANFSKRRGH